jgi:hypothetical protein
MRKSEAVYRRRIDNTITKRKCTNNDIKKLSRRLNKKKKKCIRLKIKIKTLEKPEGNHEWTTPSHWQQ